MKKPSNQKDQVETELEETYEHNLNEMQVFIRNVFKNKGLYATFGDDYINIARKDGINCEFYGTLDKNSFLNAIYTINGKEKELDYWFGEFDLDQFFDFVFDVQTILEVGPRGGLKKT